MEKVISPVSQALKKNSATINLVLVSLTVLFLFPLKYFLPFDVKGKVESEFRTLVANEWVLVVRSLLVYVSYHIANVNMLVLLLFLINHLSN